MSKNQFFIVGMVPCLILIMLWLVGINYYSAQGPHTLAIDSHKDQMISNSSGYLGVICTLWVLIITVIYNFITKPQFLNDYTNIKKEPI